METAVKRLARGAYQIGTGGGVRGRQVNSSPATYSISCLERPPQALQASDQTEDPQAVCVPHRNRHAGAAGSHRPALQELRAFF